MGIFTDYKKKMEEEKQVWESELNEYNKEIAMLKSQIKMACYEYNQEVTTINSERSGMMELIKKLYHFLKEFGEIGAKITYFDFENEAWRKIDVESIINPEKVADITNKENHANYMFAGLGVGAAKVGAITSSAMIAGTSLFAPLAVSALFFPTLFDRGSKQDYLDYCEKHMTALEEYDKNKGILNDLCKTVKLAT